MLDNKALIIKNSFGLSQSFNLEGAQALDLYRSMRGIADEYGEETQELKSGEILGNHCLFSKLANDGSFTVYIDGNAETEVQARLLNAFRASFITTINS